MPRPVEQEVELANIGLAPAYERSRLRSRVGLKRNGEVPR